METIYRCLIVDDEKPAHEVIKSHISKLPQLQFVRSVFNGKEALDALKAEQYDIVFLDIEMPIITGMELLSALHPKPAVVLCTAYTDFAFEAFQHEAVDYVQKPISFMRFQKAVDKAIIYCMQLKTMESKITHLTIKVDGQKIELPTAEILYLNSMGNYVKVYVVNHSKPYIVYDTLGNMLDALNKKEFVQIHRSAIVNKQFIVQKTIDQVTMPNGQTLPIGRKYSVLLD
jgi:two-component system, LytTR family, response regulator